MVSAATPIFTTAWWFMVFPGVALLLTVLAFNLLGDGLRDALNPRSAR
jgi:peptide/nickel transport system permease protein